MRHRSKADRLQQLVDARVSDALRTRRAEELARLKAPATPGELDLLRGLLIAQGLLPMPNVRPPGGTAIEGDKYGRPMQPAHTPEDK